MVELSWRYLKRLTTKKSPLKTGKEATKKWTKAWEDLEQTKIQAWIKRIMNYIPEVIRLKDGNNYHEVRQQ